MDKNRLNFFMVVLILLTLMLSFPPWKGYRYVTGDSEVIGEPSFIGFHYVFSRDDQIQETIPYIVVEIDYQLWLILFTPIIFAGLIGIIVIKKRAD